MNKHITVNALDADSVGNAIKELEKFEKDLNRKANILIDRLAENGVQIASAKFDSAITTGPNMTIIYPPETRGDMWKAVIATGYSALFIEFGTGVTTGSTAGDTGEMYGLNRGGYGKGYGNLPQGWYYPAQFGTGNAPNTEVTNGASKWIHTYGIPGQGCMYYTVQDLKNMFSEIAKEVFAND